MIRMFSLALVLLVAGCATPPPESQAPKALTDSQEPGVWCVLVSTFTTTVRTVYVQLGANPPPVMSVSADCAVNVPAAPTAEPAAPTAPAASALAVTK